MNKRREIAKRGGQFHVAALCIAVVLMYLAIVPINVTIAQDIISFEIDGNEYGIPYTLEEYEEHVRQAIADGYSISRAISLINNEIRAAIREEMEQIGSSNVYFSPQTRSAEAFRQWSESAGVVRFGQELRREREAALAREAQAREQARREAEQEREAERERQRAERQAAMEAIERERLAREAEQEAEEERQRAERARARQEAELEIQRWEEQFGALPYVESGLRDSNFDQWFLLGMIGARQEGLPVETAFTSFVGDIRQANGTCDTINGAKFIVLRDEYSLVEVKCNQGLYTYQVESRDGSDEATVTRR